MKNLRESLSISLKKKTGKDDFDFRDPDMGDTLSRLILALLPQLQQTEENILEVFHNQSNEEKLKYAVNLFASHNVPAFIDVSGEISETSQKKYYGTVYYRYKDNTLMAGAAGGLSSDHKKSNGESFIVDRNSPGAPPSSYLSSAFITIFGLLIVFTNLTVCVALGWYSYWEINPSLVKANIPYWFHPAILIPTCYFIII